MVCALVILFSTKKEPTIDTWYNIDKLKRYAERKKPDTKDTSCIILFVWKPRKGRQKADYSLTGAESGNGD